MYFLGVTVRSQSGMEVDPRESATGRRMTAQHVTKDAVAPRRLVTAVEQSIGAIALPARDGRLQSELSVRGDVRADPRFVLRRRRPDRGHDEVVHLGIGSVARRRTREIAEVAIHIDVIFVRARAKGKAVGVKRMVEQDRNAA